MAKYIRNMRRKRHYLPNGETEKASQSWWCVICILKGGILTAEVNEKSIPDSGKAPRINARIGNWRQAWGRLVESGGAVSLVIKEVKQRNGARTWLLISS